MKRPTRTFFPHLCEECGGSGMINMGPINHGGPSISDTCPRCKGRHQVAYWRHLEELRKQEQEKRHG